jgi:hypothetical protein
VYATNNPASRNTRLAVEGENMNMRGKNMNMKTSKKRTFGDACHELYGLSQRRGAS